MSKVKFLVLGDLHGDIPIIHSNSFDAIICPGDVCGDDIRKNLDELDEEELELEEDYEKISLTKGRKVLEFLNSLNKPIFIVPGNWDQTPYRDGIGEFTKNEKKNPWEKIKKGLNNIFDVEFTKAYYGGIAIVGHGSTSSPEPLVIGEIEDVLLDSRELFFKERFNELRSLAKGEKVLILVSHNAPYGCSLDLIDNEKSIANGEHYGSIIAREIIEEFQPILSISGHIHEGFGKEKLGNTIALNSGFRGDTNILVEIDVEQKKIISIDFFGKSKI